MDTSDPDITFNEAGVCNHCTEFTVKNWERLRDKENLKTIVAQIKKDGQGKDYDVLLGLSGGVDSSACLHHVVALGLRPLCFTVDNGWNTQEADENIMRLVEGLKVPFYRYTIDLEKFRLLQRSFIASGTPNIEIPTDHILSATTYETARKYGIKWIISGGNLATEGIMPTVWGYNARDLRFIKHVLRTHTGGTLSGLPTLSLVKYLFARFLFKIKTVNLLDYFEYNRAEAIQLLSDKYGYKPYGEKHGESHFTKWFQNQWLPYFGIVKERAHLSSLINSAQCARDEALSTLYKRATLACLPDESRKNIEYVTFNSPLGWVDLKERRSHRDYKNSEALWGGLSWIYRLTKKTS